MITQWKDLNKLQVVALKGYGGEPGVFIRASMLRALQGDGSAAIVLSQLIYWSQTESAKANDGWFYLTTQAVTKNLGMSRYIQERVRKMLVDKKILEFKRIGSPAKNWYRVHLDTVIDLLTEQFDSEEVPDEGVGNPPSSMGENPLLDSGKTPHSDGGKTPYIERTKKEQKVRIYAKSDIAPTFGKQNASSEPVSVLGERFDACVEFIRQTYPINGQGLPVTEHQARRAVKKFGDLPKTHTEEQRKVAGAAVNKFVLAIRNIRKSVDAGDLETKYVPGFDKFAGFGISYGNEPAFEKWALKVFVEKKPKLELVV